MRRTFAYAWRSETPPSDALLAHYEAAYASPTAQEAMLGYYRAAVRPRAVAGFAALVAKVRRTEDRRPRAAPDRARTLVIWGAADPAMPVSVGEAAVRDLGADTVMVTVPGAGHFPHEETPEIVVPVLARFLREGDDDVRPAEEVTRETTAEAEKAPAAKKAPGEEDPRGQEGCPSGQRPLRPRPPRPRRPRPRQEGAARRRRRPAARPRPRRGHEGRAVKAAPPPAEVASPRRTPVRTRSPPRLPDRAGQLRSWLSRRRRKLPRVSEIEAGVGTARSSPRRQSRSASSRACIRSRTSSASSRRTVRRTSSVGRLRRTAWVS